MSKYFTPLRKCLKISRRLLPRDPDTIFEFGARDCKETLAFNKALPEARIFAFECNPDTIAECRGRVKGISNVTLIEKAVSDKNGTVTFHKIDTKNTNTKWQDGNPGASSLLQASGKYPAETYVQEPVTVESTTLKKVLDEYNLPGIDLMWMDIQGAELLALIGLGERIKDVGIIHTEVEFMEVYTGQALHKDVNDYLIQHGFVFCGFTYIGRYFGDALYAKSSLLETGLYAKYYKIRGFVHANLKSVCRIWYMAEKGIEFVAKLA